jgi:L-malate glycosyltransferase
MRVLHVVKGLGPGGAERLLVSLAQVRDVDVELEVAFILLHKDHLVPELARAGVSSHVLAGRQGLRDMRWPFRLLALVRSHRPDIVHLHSPALAAVARPMLRLVVPRTPVVSTEHNVWDAFGRLSRLANAWTLPLSSAPLAVSEEVRSSIWPRLRDRVEVNVQGIPVAELARRRDERTTARATLGIGPDDVLIATVANLREKKDYPTLLRAAARCVDDPRLHFVAIGQGPLERELHVLHSRLGLGSTLRFLGYHPDPPAVVAGADMFVLTSRHEGLPISLLEAMALGVPPVATSVGGIPEVVTDGVDGVLLRPGDDAAFAAAVQRLADEPAERAALGAAAAKRAEDFDIARTQAALEALYRGLCHPG